ncbi:MAG: hypothetical protein ACR2NB_13120 [Solirubrobacteraceae bacterium]
MSDYASYEWVRPPWWRRWLARLAAVLALAGVAYGVYTIVRTGTEAHSRGPSAPAAQVAALGRSQEALAKRLEALRPGRSAKPARVALRAVQDDRGVAMVALRRRRTAGKPAIDDRPLQGALGAELDYLDAVGSVLRDPRSPLLKSVGTRAEAAKRAFTALPDSAGVAAGIRGTTALVTWAKAQ